jgi:transposase
MHVFQLYERILGLVEPWTVKNLTLKPAEQEAEAQAACAETFWGCSQRARRMRLHEWERRRWPHWDSGQSKTLIVADVPRVQCDQHGSQFVAAPRPEVNGAQWTAQAKGGMSGGRAAYWAIQTEPRRGREPRNSSTRSPRNPIRPNYAN